MKSVKEIENRAFDAGDVASEEDAIELKPTKKKGDAVRQESVPLLFTAINAGNVEGVRLHLDQTTEHINSISYGGLTPLHAACHMQQLDILNLLISRGAKVEALDSLGNSALHVAVREDWYEGVKDLLEHGASPRQMSDPPPYVSGQFKETPLHSAVRTGNLATINLMLKYNPDLSIRDRNNQTVYHLAAAVRNVPILKQLLMDGESSKVLEAMTEKSCSLYHAALPSGAKVDHEFQILKVIQLIYKCVSRDLSTVNFLGETPLFLACRLGLPDVVKFFLANGADPTQVTREGENALHAACTSGCSTTLQYLLDTNKVHHLIKETDSNGNRPFHLAIGSASLECCKILLSNGEHLAYVNDNGVTNCSIVLEKLPSAMQLFKDLFDSNVKLSKKSQYDPDFSITFDYSVLCSEKDEMQSSIACELAGTRLEPLIKHPLLESFLCIKWSRIRNIFYFNVIQYFLYLMIHTVFVLLTYGKMELRWSNHHEWYLAFKISHITLIISISIPAIIMTIANFKKMMMQWETYTRLIAMTTSAYVVFITTERRVKSTSATTAADDLPVERERALASISILFVWVELMMLLGRFPALGTYILMFTKVSKSLIKFIFSFLSLILGFSMSFHILFKKMPVFDTYSLSFAKTLMMMTGEIAYSEFVNEKGMPFDVFCLIVMSLFVFLVTVIMSNLLIGLAVNDIPHLKRLGKIKRLVKQASYLVAYEKVLTFAYKWSFFPSSLRELLFSRSSIQSVITVSPNKEDKKDMQCYSIKDETIREAISLGSNITSDDYQPNMEEDVGKQFKSFQLRYTNDRRSQKTKFEELSIMCGDLKKEVMKIQAKIDSQMTQVSSQLERHFQQNQETLERLLLNQPVMETQED